MARNASAAAIIDILLEDAVNGHILSKKYGHSPKAVIFSKGEIFTVTEDMSGERFVYKAVSTIGLEVKLYPEFVSVLRSIT